MSFVQTKPGRPFGSPFGLGRPFSPEGSRRGGWDSPTGCGGARENYFLKIINNRSYSLVLLFFSRTTNENEKHVRPFWQEEDKFLKVLTNILLNYSNKFKCRCIKYKKRIIFNAPIEQSASIIFINENNRS